MSKRLDNVDWLRVLAVLLLFPFHTWRVYNLGEDSYVKGAELSVALTYAIGFSNRWHMHGGVSEQRRRQGGAGWT